MKYLLIGALCLGFVSCNSTSKQNNAEDEAAKVKKSRGGYNLAYRKKQNRDLKSTDLAVQGTSNKYLSNDNTESVGVQL